MSHITVEKCDWREDEYVAYSEEYFAIEFGDSKEGGNAQSEIDCDVCDKLITKWGNDDGKNGVNYERY